MTSQTFDQVESMQYYKQTSATNQSCSSSNGSQNAIQDSAPPSYASTIAAPSAPDNHQATTTSNPTNIHCGAVVVGLGGTSAGNENNGRHGNTHTCCSCAQCPIAPPQQTFTGPRVFAATASSHISDAERIGAIKRID